MSNNSARFIPLVLDTMRGMVGIGGRKVQRYSRRTPIGRYLDDFINLAETQHLAGQFVDLSQIWLPNHFLHAPALIEPVYESEAQQDVLSIIPFIPDLPGIMTPYHLERYTLEELTAGSRRIVLLGNLGSGRTTALFGIALWALGIIKEREQSDPVKTRIQENEDTLKEKSRLRSPLEEAQIEELSIAIREKAQPTEHVKIYPIEKLIPFYVHLADMVFPVREEPTDVDPAEPLVRGIQHQLSPLNARAVPQIAYKAISEGRALLLIDGFDEMLAGDQNLILNWLEAFHAEYPNNFIIMTAPATGSGRITNLGFAPVYLGSWNRLEIDLFVNKWSEVYPSIVRGGKKISSLQQKRASLDNYVITPAELTLKVWSNFSVNQPDQRLEQWIRNFIDLHLPEGYTYDSILPFLTMCASLETEVGFITPQGVEILVSYGDLNTTDLDKAALDTYSQMVQQFGIADVQQIEEEQEESGLEELYTLLHSLTASGLLVEFRRTRYRFRHAIIADFLAGLTLKSLPQTNPQGLYNIAQRPRWKRALAFSATHTNLEQVVRMKLADHPDILRSSLLEVVTWLAYTPEEPSWRGEVFKRLGTYFISPQQFSTLRKRITAALIASKDQYGAMYIFKTGLKNGLPEVRMLSALGIGALGEYGKGMEQNLIALTRDQDEGVQLGAIHALGAINSSEALYALVDVLLGGSELARQTVAEVFAQIPEVGFPTLYDAVNHDDLLVRRYAIFGIRRIKKEWARELIHELFLRQDEWYVHSIAKESLSMQLAGHKGPEPIPSPSDINWVSQWAQGKGRRMPQGSKGRAMLVWGLQNTQDPLQPYLARLAGQLGIAEVTEELYKNLNSQNYEIRNAAYESLAALQIKIGKPLPNPI